MKKHNDTLWIIGILLSFISFIYIYDSSRLDNYFSIGVFIVAIISFLISIFVIIGFVLKKNSGLFPSLISFCVSLIGIIFFIYGYQYDTFRPPESKGLLDMWDISSEEKIDIIYKISYVFGEYTKEKKEFPKKYEDLVPEYLDKGIIDKIPDYIHIGIKLHPFKKTSIFYFKDNEEIFK